MLAAVAQGGRLGRLHVVPPTKQWHSVIHVDYHLQRLGSKGQKWLMTGAAMASLLGIVPRDMRRALQRPSALTLHRVL